MAEFISVYALASPKTKKIELSKRDVLGFSRAEKRGRPGGNRKKPPLYCSLFKLVKLGALWSLNQRSVGLAFKARLGLLNARKIHPMLQAKNRHWAF